MNTNTGPQEQASYTIIVGIDYAELGDHALQHACELAKGRQRAHVHVVHVETSMMAGLSEFPNASAGDLSAASTRLHTHVEKIVKRWCETGAASVPFERLTTHVRTGGAAEAIAQLASDLDAGFSGREHGKACPLRRHGGPRTRRSGARDRTPVPAVRGDASRQRRPRALVRAAS